MLTQNIKSKKLRRRMMLAPHKDDSALETHRLCFRSDTNLTIENHSDTTGNLLSGAHFGNLFRGG